MAAKNPVGLEKSEGGGSELTPGQLNAGEKLFRLAEEQGVKPVTTEKLRAMGDLWPENEDIEDFLSALHQWRGQKSQRKIS